MMTGNILASNTKDNDQQRPYGVTFEYQQPPLMEYYGTGNGGDSEAQSMTRDWNTITSIVMTLMSHCSCQLFYIMERAGIQTALYYSTGMHQIQLLLC
jgi:uncharacterized membrane protein